MLTRKSGYLRPFDGEAPAASRQLEVEGYALLEGVLDAAAVAALRAELEAVYADLPADDRTGGRRDPAEDEDFRYEMFNRSALAQRTVAHPRILEVIEPFTGGLITTVNQPAIGRQQRCRAEIAIAVPPVAGTGG